MIDAYQISSQARVNAALECLLVLRLLIWPAALWFPAPAADGPGVFLALLGDTFTHMVLYAAPFIALL